MQEHWEIHWEDYYEILQVHPSAESEVIQAAYRKLIQKYHPDINKDPAAGERTKKINIAYKILSNPEKRKRYHSEWLKRTGKITDFSGADVLPKPIPVVEPNLVRFDKVKPEEIKRASFVIRNIGGPYSRIWISNPDSWVRIVRWFSLTDSDELPLQVEIEVEGEEWGKSYIEYIRVKLDEEETQVKVELQTKPEPVREKVRVGVRPRTRATYTPPPSPPPSPPSPVSGKGGLPAWVKWIISLATLGLIIGLIAQFWSPTTQIIPLEDTASTPVVQSTSVTQPTPRWSHPTPYVRIAIPIDLNSDGKMNEIVACSGYDCLHAFSSDGELKWTVEDESSPPFYVLSLIPIDYNSDKKFNEVLLFGLWGIGEGINVFNSHGEKIYEDMTDMSEFDEMKTKYGYKISGQVIDENFNRVNLDGDEEFDDIIRIQFEDSIGVYSKK